MTARDPKECKTIYSAFNSYCETMPISADRSSFVAGAAWAFGRVQIHAQELINKTIRPELKDPK